MHGWRLGRALSLGAVVCALLGGFAACASSESDPKNDCAGCVGTCVGGRCIASPADASADSGVSSESCEPSGEASRLCYDGTPTTENIGACKSGSQSCVTTPEGAFWSVCQDQVTPVTEIQGNGVDDDCDGTVDESGDDCVFGKVESCYEGPAATEGVGACSAGARECVAPEGVLLWTPCTGQVLPAPEAANGVDDDCDGAIDEKPSHSPALATAQALHGVFYADDLATGVREHRFIRLRADGTQKGGATKVSEGDMAPDPFHAVAIPNGFGANTEFDGFLVSWLEAGTPSRLRTALVVAGDGDVALKTNADTSECGVTGFSRSSTLVVGAYVRQPWSTPRLLLNSGIYGGGNQTVELSQLPDAPCRGLQAAGAPGEIGVVVSTKTPSGYALVFGVTNANGTLKSGYPITLDTSSVGDTALGGYSGVGVAYAQGTFLVVFSKAGGTRLARVDGPTAIIDSTLSMGGGWSLGSVTAVGGALAFMAWGPSKELSQFSVPAGPGSLLQVTLSANESATSGAVAAALAGQSGSFLVAWGQQDEVYVAQTSGTQLVTQPTQASPD